MAGHARKLLRGGIGREVADPSFARANRVEPEDARAEVVARVDEERDSLATQVWDVLGTVEKDRTYTDEEVGETVQDRLEVRHQAKQGLEAAIRTGRRLRRIQDRLGPRSYKGLVRAGLALMPEALASYCRVISRAVDEKRIAVERLPATVRPAYEIAKLEPPVLEAVAERVQLGPTTTVREIKEAVAAIRAEVEPAQPADPERLERKIEELTRRRDAEIERVRHRYAKEIAAVGAQLAELRALKPRGRGRGRSAA
jgi:hypothetical protein